MSVYRNAQGRIVGWYCGCRGKKAITLSCRRCESCKQTIAQADLDAVYSQVRGELKQDVLDDTAKRWERFADFRLLNKRLYWIVMVLAVALWLGLAVALRPSIFVTLVEPVEKAVTAAAETAIELFPPVVTVLQRLWQIVGATWRLLSRFLSKVIDLIGSIF